MTSDHLWILIPIVVTLMLGTGAAFVGRLVWRSLDSLVASIGRIGARVGEAEKRLDIEEGRRLGRAEVIAEQGRKDHETK